MQSLKRGKNAKQADFNVVVLPCFQIFALKKCCPADPTRRKHVTRPIISSQMVWVEIIVITISRKPKYIYMEFLGYKLPSLVMNFITLPDTCGSLFNRKVTSNQQKKQVVGTTCSAARQRLPSTSDAGFPQKFCKCDSRWSLRRQVPEAVVHKHGPLSQLSEQILLLRIILELGPGLK